MTPSSLPHRIGRLRHSALFWISLLILNGLFFLPGYLLNRQEAAFWPLTSDLPLHQWPARLLLWRENPDIWRLNSELILFLALWHVTGHWLRQRPALRRAAAALLLLLYLFTWLYYLYESSVIALWQLEPNFYSQWQLGRDSLPLLREALRVTPALAVGAALAVVAFCLLCGGLLRATLRQAPGIGRFSRRALALLALIAAIQIAIPHPSAAAPERVVSSVTRKTAANIGRSARLRHDILAFHQALAASSRDYTHYTLTEPPDIYLIFVESYGALMATRSPFRERWPAISDRLEQQLSAAGWHSATTLSDAPTWGGGSWLSYSSTLLGLRIETHPEYLALQETFREERYPDLAWWLQKQGYDYTFFSSITTRMPHEREEADRAFFGMDRWLQFADFGYDGPLYGWGPAPPDQYVLHALRELVPPDPAGTPRLFVGITQNSHYPWDPHPERVADWRSLNNPALPDPPPDRRATVYSELKQRNYLRAIEYQMEVLAEWILETPSAENALYVLVGDHQPQQISSRRDGFATPVHIISRDAALIAPFLAHDFTPGLAFTAQAGQAPTPAWRHEGLYSLLVHALVSRYSPAWQTAPPVQPHGLTLADIPSPEE
jgi:hypothetical protein